MIHLALYMLSTLFVVAVCLVALAVGYTLLMALMRALNSWIDKALEAVAALVFCLVIVPPLWVWAKWRRWVRRQKAAS